MRRPQELADELEGMRTVLTLTSVFEGLASMRIAQIRSQVLQSKQYFDKLWQIYTQIRVDSLFRYGRDSAKVTNDKELIIVITAEGGFSGDIDQKLVELMVKAHDKTKQDIIVIGHHGAVQLTQAGIVFKKYFKLPEKDQNINVAPIVKEIQHYTKTTVFYQTYVSLTIQDVKKISLHSAIETLSKNVTNGEEIISEQNYIFEPSSFAVAGHLERSMVTIALSQVILESKLAQYASRYRAMSAAEQRADEAVNNTVLLYNRSRRGLKDERLKETISSMRKVRA